MCIMCERECVYEGRESGEGFRCPNLEPPEEQQTLWQLTQLSSPKFIVLKPQGLFTTLLRKNWLLMDETGLLDIYTYYVASNVNISTNQLIKLWVSSDVFLHIWHLNTVA